MITDNAMLRYLDGETNVKANPNENFAREMFELYSIGKGKQMGEGNYTNYTEEDIKQATKVLTGFTFDKDFTNIDADTGIPTGKARSETVDGKPCAVEHDAGTKTFSAAFGGKAISPAETVNGYPTVESAIDEISQLADMVFEQEETAKFICRKLYRFFVYYSITPEVEADIILPLAETFRNSNYELKPVLKQLLAVSIFTTRTTQ
ncbi:MAG: DUF1800 domain-containing protein [Bacteroidales bacterium]|nr:DUF1800 domain-containing protein [Bacteroidales bacterium]